MISCSRLSSSGVAAAILLLTSAATSSQLAAQSNDADAGAWRMIVLSGPTQIPVPAPAAVSDPSYQSELAAIKNSQSALTSDQQKMIDRWSGGGMLRWNQIMIDLIAEFDLPPEPNADGTYSFPSAANPFAFPIFPFSNPPYATRTLSNVSVAQYDALKAAWYYKYLYNRPSPSKTDSGIRNLGHAADLPSYPSEDAVEAGVAVPLLKIFFPTKAVFIDQMAAEQQQVAILSGKATASDVAAGLALGQAVAAIFAKRAANDGMKAATGTPAQWQALADAATARGEIPWKSQETPPRPPMLPFFGKVATWMMTPADIVNERPGPPPSTHSPQMAKELAEVKASVNNLTRDQLAIAYKWNDGASSPTPPGHWNLLAIPYMTQAQYGEVRTARALALLNMALHDAAVGCWDVKYTYFNPRAVQLDPTIKTVIPLPNFPSYTSGHSTFSAAAAEVLSYLFPNSAAFFQAQRDEAAISRLYAGIHYRSDIEVGKTHGVRIASYTLKFAKQDGADQQSSLPALSASLVDAASFGPALVPGSIATLFGTNLASHSATALTTPLPTMLGGLSVSFNGFIPAPLFFASTGQANIQVPWELQGSTSAALAVNANGTGASTTVQLAQFAPSIFSVGGGSTQGIVTIANTKTLAAPAGSIAGAHPASKGDFVTIYSLGLGAVNNTPATGKATPDNSSTTKSPVSVLVNGESVPASWSGLAPGYVGVYQVNVQVPSDVAPGNAVPLQLQIGGVKSNTVTISVQ